MHIANLRRSKWAALSIGALALFAVGLAACGDDDSTSTPTAAASPSGGSPTAAGIPNDIGKNDSANITGAGSTFAAPIYQAWADDYAKNVAKNVKVNYQSIGSGGGIQQFTAKTVDFGATDAPLSDAQVATLPDAQHIPTVLGAVVVTYNINGVTKPLKFDGDTLAKIYLGTITKWNDPAITALNPGVNLPSADIIVAHRSDGSGTSFVWTDYLSKVNADWKSKVGAATNPNWPVGQGGKGNEGVTNIVKQTPNAIGYIELQYAISNKLGFADIKNKAGKFVTPSLDSTSAAAASVTIPDDYRVSITNADGDSAYPISTFTWILIPKSTGACSSVKPIVDWLWWAFNDKTGLQDAKDLLYAPLPDVATAKVKTTLKSITCEGKVVLPQ